MFQKRGGGEGRRQDKQERSWVKAVTIFVVVVVGMSNRGAKSSPASFSDIQEVPRAIPVPADSRLCFSQLEFEAVM